MRPASERSPFQYATLRVVPRVERGEFINAGVVLFCRPRKFLAARVALDEARLAALAPDCPSAAVRPHLEAAVRIAAGDPHAGPIARLDQSQRFSWLVAPASTVIQPSAVHTGLTVDPAAALDRLFAELVAGAA
jgi:hypothetical protein